MGLEDFKKKVRVRIAPSPTGDPHIGTGYVALFNWAFARRYDGTFVLRIEDTDQTRSRPAFEQSIFDALRWLGVSWDEGPDCGGAYGPYRQSERTAIYKHYCQELLDKGFAYKCFATPEELKEMREVLRKSGSFAGYDRRYRTLSEKEVSERELLGLPYVVRLKVPLRGECFFEDGVKGSVVYPWAEIDDQILMKSDGYPTYHLANVVDDHLMEITHVLRGDEWLSSTPKHLFLYECFGWQPPQFFHMPLLIGKDKKKLSKRRNPTSIFYYKDAGYLPEAVVNFLLLMGYGAQEGEEFFDFDHFCQRFNPDKIGSSPAFFDVVKLNWLNQHYIINDLDEGRLLKSLQTWRFNEDFFRRLIPLCHTRMKTLGDFMELSSFLFVHRLLVAPDSFAICKVAPTILAAIFQVAIWRLDEIEDWTATGINVVVRYLAEFFSLSLKKVVISAFYLALTGRSSGLPLFDSFELLGKSLARERLLLAIELLGGLSVAQLDRLKSAYKAGHLGEDFAL